MLCTKLKFRANIRRTYCVWSMLSHVSRPESNLDWNQVTSRRSGDFCTLMSTPFLRDRRWILHTCLMAGPLPSPLLFIYFSPETWDPLRPKKKKRKIKKNTHTHTHIWRRKQQKIRFCTGTLNTCKISGSYLWKTAWTLNSEGIWGFILEPACKPLIWWPERGLPTSTTNVSCSGVRLFCDSRLVRKGVCSVDVHSHPPRKCI